MNFLAHLFLSGDDKDFIIGNFIADHVKGTKIDSYNHDIKTGILFHRSIDEFTDHNSIVKETLKVLRPHFRKYSGVVLDMYYDHFLAVGWSEYADISLEDFTQQKYAILMEAISELPPRSQYVLPFMVSENWLLNYRTFEGLHNSFSGIASRTKFYSNLESATSHLKDNHITYKKSFEAFFPQLVDFSRKIKLSV